MPHFVPLYYINSYIGFPSEQEIVRNNSFPPDSILSQIILIWLLWEGIYICQRKICSWMIKVGNDSFLQTQFGPKASETISQRRFLAKLFICKRKIHHKGRKRFFPTVSIRSESVWNDFSEKVFVKIKMIHISILSYSLNSVRKRLKRFLWEGIYICQRKICSWMIKVGNDSFLQTQFGPKASETISQRRFFA
jgi:hypothetical protein